MPRLPPGSRAAAVVIVVAALLLSAAYLTCALAPSVGIFHDDGVYVVTAKALAEGRGYRIISIPGQPRQTKYPILFPWVLSLVWRISPAFPANLVWLRLVPIAAGVIWFALVWRLLRLLGASPVSVALMLLATAMSPWVLFLSTALLSETVFAALLTGALILLVRLDRGDGGIGAGVAAGALMGAAFLTRTAAAVPMGASVIVLVYRRRWRAAAAYAFVFLILAAPWTLWVNQHEGEYSLDPFYTAESYRAWNLLFTYAWRQKVTVAALNLLRLSEFGQFWGIDSRRSLGVAIGWLCSALLIVGVWKRRTLVVSVVTISYLATLLGWAWPPQRFIVPLLPILIWLAYQGAGRFRSLTGVLLVILIADAVPQLWMLTRAVHEKGGTWYSAGGVDDWYAMTRQYAWIDQHTPASAVLAGIHDPTYYLFTGRQALRPYSFDPFRVYYDLDGGSQTALGTAEDFRRRLQALRADYVVVTPTDGVERLVSELTAIAPGGFSVVYARDGYKIYRVNAPQLGAQP